MFLEEIRTVDLLTMVTNGADPNFCDRRKVDVSIMMSVFLLDLLRE